jgi:Flp pilus assembly pilin Flp
MQNFMIQTYLMLKDTAERMSRDERGQTAAEYLGIVAFVVAIAAVLVTFGSGLAGGISSVVSKGLSSVGNLIP